MVTCPTISHTMDRESSQKTKSRCLLSGNVYDFPKRHAMVGSSAAHRHIEHRGGCRKAPGTANGVAINIIGTCMLLGAKSLHRFLFATAVVRSQRFQITAATVADDVLAPIIRPNSSTSTLIADVRTTGHGRRLVGVSIHRR